MNQNSWWLAAVMFGAVLVSPVAAQLVPFTQEALARGVNYTPVPAGALYSGTPIGFADLNGDGHPDLIVIGNAENRVGIFENDGTGHFIDRTGTVGIPPMVKGSNFAAGDYDGDGLVDLAIAKFGGGIHLFRNLGNFTFVEVTAQAGLTEFAATKGLSWGDLDGDGWIDLFVCNYVSAIPGTSNARNRVWRNNGNGTFTNVAEAWGLDSKAFSFIAVLTDLDGDGDLDIYLSNDRGMMMLFEPNRYWRNDGPGKFVEIGQQNGTGVALFSMGVAVGDVDRDGRTDLYCTNLPGNVAPLFGQNPLLLQTSPGMWVQQQQEWGVPVYASGWASIFLDIDCDGWEDLFVVNQTASNILFYNMGSPPMMDMTAFLGLAGPITNPYSAAYADIDGDGDLDLAVAHLGSNVQLYINHSGASNKWARFDLRGENKDLHALGGTVRVRTGSSWQMRQPMIGANGYLGQNEMTLHFGLAQASVMDEIQILWPNTGTTRVLTNYSVNQRWTLWPPSALGDANGDGIVNQQDLSLLAVNCYNPVTPGLERLDLNGDGMIDFEDYLLLTAILTGSMGDFNLDGVVNGADLALLLEAWGENGTGFDLNLDGVVNGADLAILLGNWG
ncbi:MAG: VCBS repeat-containing protein [Phycisphaeraceae bacterium]|nr:VCBS repeat-containing protein [Phycisphaeraceae bacterium]